jgi:hypothetical protein
MPFLTFTVIEITPHEGQGYHTLRVQLGTSSPDDLTTGDIITLQVSDAIGALNSVDAPLVLQSV